MTQSERSSPPAGERLQKILAAAGLGSRRQAEVWIREGRVTVNGHVVTRLGTRADPARDAIRVDGRRVSRRERIVTLLVNKPRGYLSTCSDPEKRPTVMDLVPGVRERLYPVGRLDYDSEGLLILTNDGELAHAVTHPRNRCPKVYRAKVKGKPPEDLLARVARGVNLAERRTLPARVVQTRSGQNTWLEIRLIEGRKNQIRRVFETIGFPVLKLKRIGIGGISDRGLAPGRWRKLTAREIQELKKTSS